MSPTTSWVLAHDVIGLVSSLFICVWHDIRGPLRGCPRQGHGALHRFSLAGRCPRGYASFTRRCRPRDGFSCTGNILVRLGSKRRTWGIDVRPFCRAVTRAVDASPLARMGMVGSRALDDRVHLSHAALVSALTGGAISESGRKAKLRGDQRISALAPKAAVFRLYEYIPSFANISSRACAPSQTG